MDLVGYDERTRRGEEEKEMMMMMNEVGSWKGKERVTMAIFLCRYV